MTTVARAKSKNVARPSPHNHQGDREEASFRAVQRMVQLLEEEVIPTLSDRTDQANGEEAGADESERPPVGRAPGDGPHQDGAMPESVLWSLTELQQELHAEPAGAVGSLFRTLSKGRGESGEEMETRLARAPGRGKGVGAGPIKVAPGVRIGPIGRVLVRILRHYPKKHELVVTSGYRPGPGSYHGGLPYRGSPAAAIDISAGSPNKARKMRDVAKWLYNHFAAGTVELIHTTPFATDAGFYVKNQRKYPGGGPYDSQTRMEHRDHVHFATSKALANRILTRLRKPRPRAQRPV
jgi:hypothetical protein